jgi:hypothetical protein
MEGPRPALAHERLHRLAGHWHGDGTVVFAGHGVMTYDTLVNVAFTCASYLPGYPLFFGR